MSTLSLLLWSIAFTYYFMYFFLPRIPKSDGHNQVEIHFAAIILVAVADTSILTLG